MNETSLILLGPDPFDRDAIIRSLQERFSGATFMTISATDLTDAHLQPSLFATDMQVLVIEEAERLKNESLQRVVQFLAHSRHAFFLLLIASSRVSAELTKICPVQDFLGEKPWEKEPKRAKWISSFFQAQKVVISPPLASLLAKECGDDLALLKNELEKLIAYVGTRKEVHKQDIDAVVTMESKASLWPLSDLFLQKNAIQTWRLIKELEAQDVHWMVMLRHLRHTVHQALQMKSLAQAGGTPQAMREHFPQLRGNLFDKNFDRAKACKASFLAKAIVFIDKTEYQLKNSPEDEEGVLLRFIGEVFA